MSIAKSELSALRHVALLKNRGEVSWCVCGGWAIDLWLNELTRPHKDIDIAVRRQDQTRIQTHLVVDGWQLDIAHRGELTSWKLGEVLKAPYHTVWCRRDNQFFEILLNEWDTERFCYRRDPLVWLPNAVAIKQSATDLPVLAPEFVLLYKSSEPETPENQSDFVAAYPLLEPSARSWLREAITKERQNHPWLVQFD